MDSSDLCTYKDEDRILYVGYWYDRLVRHLLKSKLLSFEEWIKEKGLNHYDIYSDTILSYVEVKGSSNMDQLKLFCDQLDSQITEIGFPFDYGFVWIFSYRNFQQKNGKKRRLLKDNGKTQKEIVNFLAMNTTAAYLVDIFLLNALRKKNGTKIYSRNKSKDRKIVSINRTELSFISSNIKSFLIELGFSEDLGKWLPPKTNGARTRIVETMLDDHIIKFQLFPLIPNSLKIRLLKQINGLIKKS